MRGTDVHQEGLFSYLSPESRIPKRHPLRPVREMVDIALSELSGQFESMYSDTGRRSIPPSKSCCGHCCCRSCIRFAVSACCVRSWTTTCCFAGSLVVDG